FYIQNRGEGGPRRSAEVLQQFLARAGKEPQLGFVNTFWRASVPQLYVDLDRDKAKALGVPIDALYGTLAATSGTYYVNDFNKYGRTWQVLMSAEPAYRKRPDSIGDIYVRSQKGEMVPLSALANVRYLQSGLGTLLGLPANTAILIVEYAVLKHHEGLSAAAAALEAARLRFRPILMTSLSCIFGVLPLAISAGAGAGARRSVGTG